MEYRVSDRVDGYPASDRVMSYVIEPWGYMVIDISDYWRMLVISGCRGIGSSGSGVIGLD